MYAIVSLLDEHHYNRIENLWHDLEVECGLSGVTLTPLPHFSWHIANEYDYRRLEASLQELAANTQPFSVRTTGLGLFTGASPVLFIPIVKDSTLAVGSYNHHQDFFGRALDITLPDGSPAHTGCVAFGLERIAFAFLAQWGLDSARWPDRVREACHA
jgi:hypothetical protein